MNTNIKLQLETKRDAESDAISIGTKLEEANQCRPALKVGKNYPTHSHRTV